MRAAGVRVVLAPAGGMHLSGRLGAAAVLGGSVAGVMGQCEPAMAGCAALGCLALALAPMPGACRRLLLLTALGAAAGLHGAYARQAALDAPILAWYRAQHLDQVLASVEGRLVADAEVNEAGDVRLRVDARRLETAQGSHATSGVVAIQVSGDHARTRVTEWTRGRWVKAPVFLRMPQLARNPGMADPDWQQMVRGVALTGSVKSGALVEVAPAGWLEEAAARARQHVRKTLSRAAAGVEPITVAMMVAVLIGDRAGLDADTIRRLQDAGTYHVIAISGGNVALLLAAMLFVLRLVFRSFRLLSVAALLVTLAYGWIVGEQPSVDRAVAAAALYLIVELAGWLVSPLDALTAIVGGMAVVDPIVTVHPSAWLSCGATAAILIGADRVRRSAAPTRSRGPLRQWAESVAAATLAAEVVLLPISAAVFTRVSLAGLLLNFIAIPAMGVIQFAGLALTLLGGWADACAVVCAQAAELACKALLDSARLVDVAPWLVWRVPAPEPGWLVAFYVGLSVAVWVTRPAWRRAGCAVAIAAGLALLCAPTVDWQGPSPGWLRLAVLDVGQGDALLLQTPDGHALGIDAGAATASFNAGERLVTPAAWALGVRRLDWLAFTHADRDHIGGITAVAASLRPREIWEGIPVTSDADWRAVREMTDRARLAVRQVRAGDRLALGPVQVDVLNPPIPDWERRRVRNDDSVVLRVRYGQVEFLLTGDAGIAAEATWSFADDGAPRLRVLKVGHHGSRTATSSEFLARYRPALAVVSVGRANAFGHPDPQVMARFVQAGIDVFRTDADGAVILETDGRVLRVRTWNGRGWMGEVSVPPA